MKIILGLFIISSFYVNAKDFTKNREEGLVKLGKFQRVVTDESKMQRENKKYLINASLFGVSFLTFSSSLEFGYYLSIDEILSLQLTGLNDRNSIEGQSEDGFAVELGYKMFVSNSFYIKPELYYRAQNREVEYDYLIDRYEFKDFKDIGIFFKIGNQWQWDNFTIGCDWLGIGRTVLALEDSDDYFDRSAEISYLNFYLGMSF